MLSKLIKIALFLIVFVLLSFKGLEFWLQQQVNQPIEIDQPLSVEIKPGSNLNRFTRQLEKQGVIDHVWAIRLFAKLNHLEKVMAGDYVLNPRESLLDVLHKITQGDVIEYQVSFAEGLNYQQWLTILKNTSQLEQSSAINLNEIGISVEHPEGWFFPDTYFFHKGEKDTDILLRAHAKMKSVLEEQWQKREQGLPYKTAYEALIMASIIEKETGVAYERPEIAGVFVWRLEKRMRLQTDPTVIYGLGNSYKGNITRRHLRQETPYNTYMIHGLPPTPIAMPGFEAIHAALHPKKGKSLYFVAKGDGSHQFSDTLDQHNKAVKEYQLKRRSDYRSSPTIKE